MEKILRLYLFMSLSLIANFSFAICMTESDGYLYNCIPIEDELSNQECINQYGEDFRAFLVSSTCSHTLAAELRGEEVDESVNEEQDLAEASCLSFEQGQKNNCTLWDYEPAYAYCSEYYGDQYLPHQLTKQCSVDLADKIYGYVPATKLNEKLEARFAEIEAMTTMIDRQGFGDSLVGFVSNKPVIGNEFYTPVMKGLLSKLVVLKSDLGARSLFKVKFDENEMAKFLVFNIRYLNLVDRIHKVYAYVAHRNHITLRSYSFNYLANLNLQLKKVYALEILAKINLKVKNLDNGMIEFFQSEQNKQLLEYKSIAEPENKVDYAKLVTFLGIRENINNLWALDRIDEENLLYDSPKECREFLSLRSKTNYKHLSELPIVKENKEYDVFYHDYLSRETDLISASLKVNLVQKEIMLEGLKNLYETHSGYKELIDNAINGDASYLANYFASDIEMLMQAEFNDWNNFVQFHFRSIVMPADGILNKDKIIERIVEESFSRRKKSIISAYQGLYVWLEDGELKKIQSDLECLIEDKLKSGFKKELKQKLLVGLESFNNNKRLAKIRYDEKVEETLKIAKKYAHAAHAYGAMKRGDKARKPFLPASFEELVILFEDKIATEFHDIKLTLEKNSKQASLLSKFFTEVAEKFNADHLVQDFSSQIELVGDRDERQRALFQAFFETAHDYYLKNNFELSQMAMVPEAVLLARDREEMTKNPYVIQVYRDGTPVTVSLEEFYAAFMKDLKVSAPKVEKVVQSKKSGFDWKSLWSSPTEAELRSKQMALFGVTDLYDYGNRTKLDMITDGTFDRPQSYLSMDGSITSVKVYPHVGNDALKRLYKQSLRLTQFEIKENQKLNKEQEQSQKEFEEEFYEDVKIIQTPQKLFARLFELFKIPMGSIANNKGVHQFNFNEKEQSVIAKSLLTKAYSEAPILRNEIDTIEEVTEWVISSHAMVDRAPYQVTTNKSVSRPLLLKIGLYAYNPYTLEVEQGEAEQLIEKTLKKAKVNAKDKFDHFCQANYLNYKNDDHFKTAFKASKYLRETLMSPVGTTAYVAKSIKGFDEEIQKEIRSFMQALNEDYIEPALLYVGIAALLAVAIIAAIGTAGVSAPATVALLTMFLSVEFYASFALVGASLYTRINTQFIEVPAQLKFQESLAHSQIDFAKIADYDMVAADKKANRVTQTWTIALMPLDLIYGYSVVKSVRSSLGFTGVKAYEKLTGLKMRGYGAKPKSLRINRRYRDLTREYGLIKGTKLKLGDVVKNLRMRLPRYQVVPEHQIRTSALRVGLGRRFRELKIHNKPWVIVDEIKQHVTKLDQRFTRYKQYLVEEAKHIEKIQLNKNMSLKEIMEHGTQYSKFGFTIRSAMKAMKRGEFLHYLKSYGETIEILKRAQRKLIQNKMDKMKGLLTKIEDFQKLKSGTNQSDDLIDDLLKSLTDQDITLLEKMSNDKNMVLEALTGRQTGYLRELRPTFKTYQEMVRSLRPASYLYGHADLEFTQQKYEAMDFLYNDTLGKYTYQSSSEDLVNFYESMLRQNAFNDEATKLVRESVEDHLSRLFTINADGVRVYY